MPQNRRPLGPPRPAQPPQEPVQPPEEETFFILEEDTNPALTPQQVAQQAILEIDNQQLKVQVAERDTLIADVVAERNQIKNALNTATTKVNELTVQTEELQEELTAMMRPPLDFGVVTGVNSDGTADVRTDGEPHRVGVHPSINRDGLKVGTMVLLNGKSLVIQGLATDVELTGEQAQITEILSERTALIEDSHSQKQVVIIGETVPAEALEPGTPVILNESVIVRTTNQPGRASALGMGSRFLLAEMPDVTFDDIGGLDAELKRLVSALENPHRVREGYERLKRKGTFSAILLGLPGNGKTMIAKAIARRQFDLHRDDILKYAKGNFFAVGGTELYSKWLGDTERFIREIIAAAQRLYQLTGAVSTVFFDDCESFFLTRSAGLSTNINGSVVTQFSTLIDGVRQMHGVNLIAATNRLDLMDLAVVRRFDRQVRIKSPSTPDRAGAILRKHLAGLPFIGVDAQQVEERLVAEIFARTRENDLVEVFFRRDDEGDDSEVVRLSDLISGKFLRDVIENAKDLAIEREAEKTEATDRVWALTYEDLRASLDSELRNKESLPTTQATIADWLMQKGDKREVDYVVNLRERRASEAKRDKVMDDKVV